MTEDVMALIRENPVNVTRLHALLERMNTVDIADTFEELSKEKTIQVFRLLPKTMAADVFSYIVPEQQQVIVEALTDSEVGKIINELFVDDAVDFIEEMPAVVVSRVLRNASDEKRRLINQILNYPEDSAGSVMTTEYVELREDTTVREAFDYIRMNGVNKETIYTCYVTNPAKRLIGAVSAETLMLSDPAERIGNIMEPSPVFAQTTDDRETTAALVRKYGLLALPVVDQEHQLVGIVTVDDIVTIIEEENTEDFEKMAALTPSGEPYLKTGVVRLAENRILWLLVLMLSAAVTGGIIASFERSLSVLPSLIGFIPMLMGAGGNAGAQSSTVVIRGMALGEIRIQDILKVLWRELRVGAICGLCLGAANFVRIFLMYGKDALLSLAVTLSLFTTIIIAKGIGCMLPILAKKWKLDPAIMASPLITTIVDCASLIIFFTVAKSILAL